MKTIRTFFTVCALLLLAIACHHPKTSEDNIILDENSVTAFALRIEQSVLNGNPKVYNEAFDKKYLKSLVRDNSIVNSSLDTDFGQDFFESNFHAGDEAVSLIDHSGDFKFVRYYFDEEDHRHHIVFRTYNDFILNFFDYIVDTLGNEMVIKDGFIYNTGGKFSDNIRENILLNVLYKTNPEGITATLSQIKELGSQGKHKEALQLLQQHETELSNLSYYWQLYIANLYQTCPKECYIDSLKQLETKGLDQRMLLLHQVMFYLNEGMPEANESTINQLIEYAGDDPIFLLVFGKTNYYAKQYETALACYETAGQYLPPLWDLWYGQLECLHALHDTESFNQCLEAAKQNYGMTDEEVTKLKMNFQ
ncbi:MAG: hypothetical protein J5644_05800 [Bacteroidales bacterium]|nr:hypothetical protein [Bacteroidales bacterium]